MWQAMAAGAAAGALGGMMGSSQSSQTQLGQKSAIGRQSEKSLSELLAELEGLAGKGAGAKDVQASLQSQRNLASMFGQYAQGGFLPSAQDMQTANQQAFNLFGGQRAALQSSFLGQMQGANRQAASLGRSTNDPILQAQLRGQQFRSEMELAGQQQAMSQQLAMQMPLQRLQFAQGQTDIMSQLANQAFQNRLAVSQLGTNIFNSANQLRMAGATTTQSTPGGLQGAITGGLAGAGIMGKTASLFQPQGNNVG